MTVNLFRNFQIDTVLPDIAAANHMQLFQLISAYIAKATNLDRLDILDALNQAEQNMPSGVGNGVAVPALTMPDLEKPYTLFARLTNPVDFKAPDSMPVDLVFLLISPEGDGPFHLQRLSKISRLMRSPDIYLRLRGAECADAVRVILQADTFEKLAA